TTIIAPAVHQAWPNLARGLLGCRRTPRALSKSHGPQSASHTQATAAPPLWSVAQHDSLLTPNSRPHGGAVLRPTFPVAAAPVCQGRELSLPSCTPSCQNLHVIL